LFLRFAHFYKFCAAKAPEHSFQGRIKPASRRAIELVARRSKQKVSLEDLMDWVVAFLVVALIAGVLGFGGVAGLSIEIGKTIFFIAVVLFLISAVVGLARDRTRV
jgi:uncharacterized membrane protein YtjA (UPF0391 family)